MIHRLSNPLATATVVAALAIGTILSNRAAAQEKQTLSLGGTLAGSLTLSGYLGVGGRQGVLRQHPRSG